MFHNWDKISRILAALLVILALKSEVCWGQMEKYLTDEAVKAWAPLIVFHEQERYFPLSPEEFLEHVYPAKSDGTPANKELPIGRSSQALHLTTKTDLEQLMSRTSFLNGRNPERYSIPIYAIITKCAGEKLNVSSKNQSLFFVTYWFFSPYNEGKKVCMFASKIPLPPVFGKCPLGSIKTMGNHVGDFEHVTISFDTSYQPVEMFVSTHDVGAYYTYNKQARIFKYTKQKHRKGFLQHLKYPPLVRLQNRRPVLFAAQGSHGLWAESGLHKYHKLPNLYDKTSNGIKWKTWKDVKIYHLGYSEQPDWMKFFGRWGNPKSNCMFFGICELSDAPHGIADRPHDIYC